MVEIQVFFDDSYEDVNGDSDPDLSLYGVFCGAIESLDPEMLLDPFEKQLHLPSAAIEIGNCFGRQDKIVFIFLSVGENETRRAVPSEDLLFIKNSFYRNNPFMSFCYKNLIFKESPAGRGGEKQHRGRRGGDEADIEGIPFSIFCATTQ